MPPLITLAGEVLVRPLILPLRSLAGVRCAMLCLAAAVVAVVVPAAWAQSGTPSAAPTQAAEVPERSLGEWLQRLHDASRRRAYVGTFVVSSAAGALTSSRIWHVCDGEQQMERVESLTGAPRSTFRRNDEVITFMPESKRARLEKRESLGLFPNLQATHSNAMAEFYSARRVGSERVAGLDADIVQLAPKDDLRFGYRIWSEKKTGLVVKLQTLDSQGRVLEQAAFSELQLDAPVKMGRLAQMMSNTEGYRVEKVEPVRTTAQAQGWALAAPVPGFSSLSCHKHPVVGEADTAMQWTFSDGLASVSLFVEPYDAKRHTQEAWMSMGATQTLMRRLPAKGGDWWLTAMGEVPASTLKAFAQSLERKK